MVDDDRQTRPLSRLKNLSGTYLRLEFPDDICNGEVCLVQEITAIRITKKGQYIALLDSDGPMDAPENREQLQILNNNPEVASGFCVLLGSKKQAVKLTLP